MLRGPRTLAAAAGLLVFLLCSPGPFFFADAKDKRRKRKRNAPREPYYLPQPPPVYHAYPPAYAPQPWRPPGDETFEDVPGGGVFVSGSYYMSQWHKNFVQTQISFFKFGLQTIHFLYHHFFERPDVQPSEWHLSQFYQNVFWSAPSFMTHRLQGAVDAAIQSSIAERFTAWEKLYDVLAKLLSVWSAELENVETEYLMHGGGRFMGWLRMDDFADLYFLSCGRTQADPQLTSPTAATLGEYLVAVSSQLPAITREFTALAANVESQMEGWNQLNFRQQVNQKHNLRRASEAQLHVVLQDISARISAYCQRYTQVRGNEGNFYAAVAEANNAMQPASWPELDRMFTPPDQYAAKQLALNQYYYPQQAPPTVTKPGKQPMLIIGVDGVARLVDPTKPGDVDIRTSGSVYKPGYGSLHRILETRVTAEEKRIAEEKFIGHVKEAQWDLPQNARHDGMPWASTFDWSVDPELAVRLKVKSDGKCDTSIIRVLGHKIDEVTVDKFQKVGRVFHDWVNSGHLHIWYALANDASRSFLLSEDGLSTRIRLRAQLYCGWDAVNKRPHVIERFLANLSPLTPDAWINIGYLTDSARPETSVLEIRELVEQYASRVLTQGGDYFRDIRRKGTCASAHLWQEGEEGMGYSNTCVMLPGFVDLKNPRHTIFAQCLGVFPAGTRFIVDSNIRPRIPAELENHLVSLSSNLNAMLIHPLFQEPQQQQPPPPPPQQQPDMGLSKPQFGLGNGQFPIGGGLNPYGDGGYPGMMPWGNGPEPLALRRRIRRAKGGGRRRGKKKRKERRRRRRNKHRAPPHGGGRWNGNKDVPAWVVGGKRGGYRPFKDFGVYRPFFGNEGEDRNPWSNSGPDIYTDDFTVDERDHENGMDVGELDGGRAVVIGSASGSAVETGNGLLFRPGVGVVRSGGASGLMRRVMNGGERGVGDGRLPPGLERRGDLIVFNAKATRNAQPIVSDLQDNKVLAAYQKRQAERAASNSFQAPTVGLVATSANSGMQHPPPQVDLRISSMPPVQASQVIREQMPLSLRGAAPSFLQLRGPASNRVAPGRGPGSVGPPGRGPASVGPPGRGPASVGPPGRGPASVGPPAPPPPQQQQQLPAGSTAPGGIDQRVGGAGPNAVPPQMMHPGVAMAPGGLPLSTVIQVRQQIQMLAEQLDNLRENPPTVTGWTYCKVPDDQLKTKRKDAAPMEGGEFVSLSKAGQRDRRTCYANPSGAPFPPPDFTWVDPHDTTYRDSLTAWAFQADQTLRIIRGILNPPAPPAAESGAAKAAGSTVSEPPGKLSSVSSVGRPPTSSHSTSVVARPMPSSGSPSKNG